MKRGWPALARMAWVLAALAGSGNVLAAKDEKAIPLVQLAIDYQTVVFWGEHRPFLLRVYLHLDDKPSSETANAFFDSLFRHLDRNKDGVLSGEEVRHALQGPVLAGLLLGNVTPLARGSNASLMEMDTTPQDGKVTLDEFKKYYSLNGLTSFQVRSIQDSENSNDLTNALFSHLDKNKDGKLSRDELNAAPSLLRPLDFDEDEMLSAEELEPAVALRRQPANLPNRMIKGAIPASSLDWVPPGSPSPDLVAKILGRYDKDQKKVVTASEIGLDPDRFARLDLKKRGELGAEELAAYFTLPPDLQFTVNRSRTGSKISLSQAPLPADVIVRQRNNSNLYLTLGDDQIHLQAVDGPSGFETIRAFILQQFRAADPDKKGYVGKKNVAANQNPFLALLFPLADLNDDDKLTEKELASCLDILAKGATLGATLTASDQGTGLFEALDFNHDRRLSVRELRTAWARVAPWDRDRDGLLTRDEIPHQYRLTFSLGSELNPTPAPSMMQNVLFDTPGNNRGPLWFRKMDRNGDGDVSPKEFLSTAADFKAIDINGDGLIDAVEAEKADARFRSKLLHRR